MKGDVTKLKIDVVNELPGFTREIFMTSKSVQYCRCAGGCDNLHLVLLDVNGLPFAQAVMNVHMLSDALTVAERIKNGDVDRHD